MLPLRALIRKTLPPVRRVLLGTPVGSLAALCAVSLVLEENYPFSDFPMYSNPSPEREFFVVRDADGGPIPVATLTGITSPKVGKIYRRKATEASPEGIRGWRDLPLSESQRIGGELLSYLREQAERRNRGTLPERLRLELVRFGHEEGRFVERSKLLAEEP